jgi:hypothetical protein
VPVKLEKLFIVNVIMFKFLALMFVALVATTNVAFAASSNSDLRVVLTAPSSVAINTPTVYTVEVKNFGPKTAEGTVLTVTLPLTNTSPTTAILGTVSGLSTGCSVVNKKIVCALGSLRNGRTVSVSYTYTAPVANKPLTMTAVGTVSNTDPIMGNNTSSVTPSFAYPSRVITGASTSLAILNSHCTGTALTSYFECMLFPSSIATHEVSFEPNGTISFTEVGYTGVWSQPSNYQLHFEYFDEFGKIAEFDGFATNGNNCFDGMTNFFPTSPYVSPYHVCVQ